MLSWNHVEREPRVLKVQDGLLHVYIYDMSIHYYNSIELAICQCCSKQFLYINSFGPQQQTYEVGIFLFPPVME